jgi:hypothetical protein
MLNSAQLPAQVADGKGLLGSENMDRSGTEMGTNTWPVERRRYPRTFLGVPVRVHYAGVTQSLTLELCDVSYEGSLFRTAGPKPRRGQWVAYGFVTADRTVCAARGRVVRVDESGFALHLESANSAFQNFVADISTPFRRAAA